MFPIPIVQNKCAIAQAIDQTVNNMNSPKRNPPENIGINIPNIACKA